MLQLPNSYSYFIPVNKVKKCIVVYTVPTLFQLFKVSKSVDVPGLKAYH